jgi:MOSC domain-containing protein YiiM
LKHIGSVKKLFITNKDSKIRIEVTDINCDEYGIIGDKFYKKDKNRSILLSSLNSYNKVKENNIDIKYGLLGENILLDFNPHDLSIGTKIKISNVILEISQECTICNHLSKIDKKLPKLLKKDRGIFVYAIKNGKISIDDKVYII